MNFVPKQGIRQFIGVIPTANNSLKVMGGKMASCPNCKSTNVRERNVGKKTGGVIGGVGGALGGASAGAAVGSIVPGIGTAVGAVVGGLLGRFAAASAGAAAGAVTGSALDGIVFDKYICRDCEHTFD
nr:hypothetical protein [Enterobacter sichuanensis]